MKRLSKWLLVAGLPLLLALVVPAAAGKFPPTRSLPTRGNVTGLAFYGSRVLYGLSPYGITPESVHVWDVLTGRLSTVHRARQEAPHGGAAFAVAAGRVAWIDRVEARVRPTSTCSPHRCRASTSGNWRARCGMTTTLPSPRWPAG
jgi:hypothetical protein